jgi:hypothetical protein
MTRRHVRAATLGAAGFLAALAALASCGARTPLFAIEPEPDAGQAAPRDAMTHPPPDSRPPPVDAFDAGEEPDVGFDSGADTLPPIDARFADVVVDQCPDAAATLVYVLTENNELWSFFPPSLTFTMIGTLACPASPNATPFSMAVDRNGTAYSVFTDGTLFQVDVATAACIATSFAPDQSGFSTFGMGFTADPTDGGETLFVAESGFGAGVRDDSTGIASIDTTSFDLSFVAPFTPAIPGPELTGTSDGRLFGFFTNTMGSGSNIVEIDRTSGELVAQNPLQAGSPDDGYAFAFWGGSFWVFTEEGGPTQVTHFDPATLIETTATVFPEPVVGAGVSTCAPQ